MKKNSLLFAIALLLAGCGAEKKIQNAVREQLKDPASGQFKEAVISENGKNACVQWNAKNGFGGYGEWNIAVLQKSGEEWVAIEMKSIKHKQCSVATMKLEQEGQDRRYAAVSEAYDLLTKSTGNSVEKLPKGCRQMADFYGREIKSLYLTEQKTSDEFIIGLHKKTVNELKDEMLAGKC